jgi:hypothetical protein
MISSGDKFSRPLLQIVGPGRKSRTLARTPSSCSSQDLHGRVVHAATGELLRELTIDPTRDCKPTGNTRYPHRKTEP